MTGPPGTRSGLLVVRAWAEEEEFRARITQAIDVGSSEQVEFVVSSAEEVYSAVRSWLEAFTAP